MALQRNFDPELENLRNEVEGPPNLDKIILETQRLSSQIHSAYLFENIGIKLLQKICLLMSSTPSGKLYSGWQEFAIQLGLTREQIQCIDYDFKGLQDPTYYVLLAFAQLPQATIDKILIAFQKLSRLDIINRISDVLTEFINSLKITNNSQEIIKPRSSPRVPLVLRPLCIETNSLPTSSNHLTNEKTVLNDKKEYNQHSYGSIVMLTFAKDGEILAKKIAEVFRDKTPKIGVVILQEQKKYVYCQAEEFVDDCFKQVNYIIPILTNEYINYINNSIDNYYNPVEDSLDIKYAKYIFSLLRYEYVKNKCSNNRVRCIVPSDEIKTVIKSDLHPTLQAWFRHSDLDAFAENVLLKKF